MRKIYASIDIGSDTIKFVVAELINGKMYVLTSNSIKSKGVRKGLIFDSNLVTNAIKDGMKEINEDLGINIKKVIVNVAENNAKFMFVTGSVDVKDENGIISSEDVSRVIKESVYAKLASDYELMTVIPLEFIIDDANIVEKPVGHIGKRLQVKGIMISTPKNNIYSVLNAVEQAGLEVVDITFATLGDYHEVKTTNLDKMVGAVVNLGHETTTVSVFNKSILMNTEVIEVGGLNVEKDLSYVFGISVFDGRVIKEKFASCHKRFCQLNETYEVKNIVGERLRLNQLEVSEVVMSRMQEILNMAKKKISELTKQEINYIVITGGLTEIKSFRNLAFEIFGKGVIIYTENTLGVRDNMFTTSLGMLKYFDNKMDERGKNYTMVDDASQEILVTPDTKTKNNTIITKIFDNFMTSKEER